MQEKKGNPMKTETREIGQFSKIKFKDFGTLILTQGERESLTIEADDSLIDELIAEVRGDTLVLGLAEQNWFADHFHLFLIQSEGHLSPHLRLARKDQRQRQMRPALCRDGRRRR
jgi:hypothetical protein